MFFERELDGKYKLVADTDKMTIYIVNHHNNIPIPEDEPVFLLRARDNLAIDTLDNYMSLCIADECTKYQIDGVGNMLGKFENFANNNPERMKQPGITQGR